MSCDATRAACELASWFRRGDLPAGYLESAPLLPATPPEAGPARLNFHGQDYTLGGSTFSLGHHFACDLVFDRDRYPQVSSRHCEIVFDRRHYVLRDSGRHGTAVNDRPVHQQVSLHPGDWISLGPPAGPNGSAAPDDGSVWVGAPPPEHAGMPPPPPPTASALPPPTTLPPSTLPAPPPPPRPDPAEDPSSDG